MLVCVFKKGLLVQLNISIEITFTLLETVENKAPPTLVKIIPGNSNS